LIGAISLLTRYVPSKSGDQRGRREEDDHEPQTCHAAPDPAAVPAVARVHECAQVWACAHPQAFGALEPFLCLEHLRLSEQGVVRAATGFPRVRLGLEPQTTVKLVALLLEPTGEGEPLFEQRIVRQLYG